MARPRGQKGGCPSSGNEFFTWVASPESKRRRKFLALLRAGHRDYVLNEAAREYRVRQKLPKAQRQLLAEEGAVAEQAHGEAHLKQLGISTARHIQSATAGALLGRALSPELLPDLVILSDAAGPFNGLRHAWCWIPAERTLQTLLPVSAEQRGAVETGRGQIWDFAQARQAYQQAPCPQQKGQLAAHFAEIFTTKTCFQRLHLALKRRQQNKSELLLGLDPPEVPLHNNGSEREIRAYM